MAGALFGLGHCADPIDAPSAFSAERYLCGPDNTTAFDALVEEIDIGGPSLVRGAAKNFRDVLVVVDPVDYPRLTAALDEGPRLEFRFELGGGRPFAQFVALVRPVNGEIATYDRLSFRASAETPMRVALQLRASGRDNPPRWQRSAYLDPTPRDVSVRFADATPVVGLNASAGGPLPAASIGALMFVVDTNHTKPGARGMITISDVAYVR